MRPGIAGLGAALGMLIVAAPPALPVGALQLREIWTHDTGG